MLSMPFILLDAVEAPEKPDCWPPVVFKLFGHLSLLLAIDLRELNFRAKSDPSCLYDHSVISL